MFIMHLNKHTYVFNYRVYILCIHTYMYIVYIFIKFPRILLDDDNTKNCDAAPK